MALLAIIRLYQQQPCHIRVWPAMISKTSWFVWRQLPRTARGNRPRVEAAIIRGHRVRKDVLVLPFNSLACRHSHVGRFEVHLLNDDRLRRGRGSNPLGYYSAAEYDE